MLLLPFLYRSDRLQANRLVVTVEDIQTYPLLVLAEYLHEMVSVVPSNESHLIQSNEQLWKTLDGSMVRIQEMLFTEFLFQLITERCIACFS